MRRLMQCRLLPFLRLFDFVGSQVSGYAANGENYFTNPPLPVFGPGDYRGIKTYQTGTPFTITWSTDRENVWLLLAQEGNTNTRVLAENISATHFEWSANPPFETTPLNQTFFLLFYDNPNEPYLAISQYFNLTEPTVTSTTAVPSSYDTETSPPATATTPFVGSNPGNANATSAAEPVSAPLSESSDTSSEVSEAPNAVPIGVGVGVGMFIALGAIATALWFLRKKKRNLQNLARFSSRSPAPIGQVETNGQIKIPDYKIDLHANRIGMGGYSNIHPTQQYCRQEMP